MKNLNYIVALVFILFTYNIKGQIVKIEKKTEPVVVPPPPTIINEDLNSVPPLPTGDRIVFWVHGLGGDQFSWDKAAENTADVYKITSLQNTLDYSTNSLSGAGQVLQNTIDGLSNNFSPLLEIEDPGNSNFIIAHSQGGLVSRAAYRRYDSLDFIDERSFGGIVTFGTPHQGTQIINNVPIFLDFINNSCNVLTAGPLKEAWNGNWFLSFFSTEGLENKIHSVCELVSSKIIPFMLNDYLTPITSDYSVGSEYLADLNQYDSDMDELSEEGIFKVAFYGAEEEPVVWRTVYSLLNNVNAEEAFHADADSSIILKANSNQNKYYIKYMAYNNLIGLTATECYNIIGAEAFIPNWNIYACNPENLNYQYNEYGYFISNQVVWYPYNLSKIAENTIAYYYGWQWWIEAEETYLSLIGAVDYQIAGCHCDCLEKYGNDPTPYEVLHSIDCDDNCDNFMNNPPPNTNVIHCDYAIVYEKYIKPNDGVVLIESAQDYPGANNGSDNLMTNTNHLQMRNNSETHEKLQSLLSGNDGLFFDTDTR
jgi:hypothetical protein